MERIQLKEMYEEYFPQIYNHIYFRVLSKDLADDLTSIVFVKAVKNIERFDESKGSFKTWIFTIAKFTLIDYYRLRKNDVPIDSEQTLNIRQDFDEQSELLLSEERQALHKALSALEPRTREIISLKYNAEMSLHEISKLLEINESTASTLHIRGIKKLRSILSADFYRDEL